MSRIMTPYGIKLLLHIYTTSGPWLDRDVPAYRPTISILLGEGLIERGAASGDGEETYVCTEKGQAHCAQLCELPYPRKKWIDSLGNLIEI